MKRNVGYVVTSSTIIYIDDRYKRLENNFTQSIVALRRLSYEKDTFAVLGMKSTGSIVTNTDKHAQ